MSNLLESLHIIDTLYDPNGGEKVICYRNPRRQTESLYKVWIYLDGPSLPFVDRVTYVLHPTFPNPERTLARSLSNPNCEMVIWAWGVFTLKAVVEDKQGKLLKINHYLTFGRQLQEALKANVKFREA